MSEYGHVEKPFLDQLDALGYISEFLAARNAGKPGPSR